MCLVSLGLVTQTKFDLGLLFLTLVSQKLVGFVLLTNLYIGVVSLGLLNPNLPCICASLITQPHHPQKA